MGLRLARPAGLEGWRNQPNQIQRLSKLNMSDLSLVTFFLFKNSNFQCSEAINGLIDLDINNVLSLDL